MHALLCSNHDLITASFLLLSDKWRRQGANLSATEIGPMKRWSWGKQMKTGLLHQHWSLVWDSVEHTRWSRLFPQSPTWSSEEGWAGRMAADLFRTWAIGPFSRHCHAPPIFTFLYWSTAGQGSGRAIKCWLHTGGCTRKEATHTHTHWSVENKVKCSQEGWFSPRPERELSGTRRASPLPHPWSSQWRSQFALHHHHHHHHQHHPRQPCQRSSSFALSRVGGDPPAVQLWCQQPKANMAFGSRWWFCNSWHETWNNWTPGKQIQKVQSLS